MTGTLDATVEAHAGRRGLHKAPVALADAPTAGDTPRHPDGSYVPASWTLVAMVAEGGTTSSRHQPARLLAELAPQPRR